MSCKKEYAFKLREDMPPGFIANAQYPELPAINQYLTPFNGQTFKSLGEFKETVIDRFLEYLNNVPSGSDRELRKGLSIEKLPENKWNWEYSVFTPAGNGPGMCVFGGLEKITEQK